MPPTVIETEVKTPSTTSFKSYIYFYTLFLYLFILPPSVTESVVGSPSTTNSLKYLKQNCSPRYYSRGCKVHHALVLSTSHSQNEMQLLVGYWLRVSCGIHLTCESARQRYPKWGILKVHNAQNAMNSSITANSIKDLAPSPNKSSKKVVQINWKLSDQRVLS